MEKHFRDDKSSRRNENGSEFEEIDTDCNFLKNISSVRLKNTLETIIDPEEFERIDTNCKKIKKLNQ